MQLAQFPFGDTWQSLFRSILYFDAAIGSRPVPKAGQAAIDAYLDRQEGGRLIQSIKSLASDRLFRQTQIAGYVFTFEDLVAEILRALSKGLPVPPGSRWKKVIAGRPVRFVGAKTPEDDAFAVERLRRAFALAGFENVNFEYEPVGAAWFYESSLDHDELMLIADFGGGTSDFSLLRVGPSVRKRGRTPEDLVGSEGVPVAGDSFDAAMVRHLVSPRLGSGSHYRSLGKVLPVPHSLYRKLERWHHLSFLRSKETMQVLRSLEAQADHPDRIGLLIELVERDLGFQLHRAIQRTKAELSHAQEASFRFSEPGLTIEEPVTRRAFEKWIGDDLHRLENGLDILLARTGVPANAVDRVFLTGGSSLVPAVRNIFVSRFGPERIRVGDEFTSVALGLALRSQA